MSRCLKVPRSSVQTVLSSITTMGMSSHHSAQKPVLTRPPRMERERTLKHFPTYGGINEGSSGETCPTCRGTGRIPRGQLVAVIPCNDVRLKPRRTKLYVCISMGVCLFLCCLILFFLFPRSITMAPVSVLSVMVYIAPDTITMEVTNLINITNENFVPVQVADFSIQGLVAEQVVGKSKMTNMTALQSRSQQSVSFTQD
uniref:Transmembrane protein 106A n=1 Tax=Stegastes partitus TaxID=144197 RepID=A0A3B4Z8G9_9TELE